MVEYESKSLAPTTIAAVALVNAFEDFDQAVAIWREIYLLAIVNISIVSALPIVLAAAFVAHNTFALVIATS